MARWRYGFLLLVLAALILALALAWTLGGNHAAQATPSGGSIKITQAAAEELEKNVRNQIFDLNQQAFRLTLTDQQVTSFVNLKNANVPLDHPQIWFAQGKTFMSGSFTLLCLFHPEVLVVAAPQVRDRKVQANVQQIYVGAFQLPQSWLQMISKSISDSIDEAQINLSFEKIEILEGELIISGVKRSQ